MDPTLRERMEEIRHQLSSTRDDVSEDEDPFNIPELPRERMMRREANKEESTATAPMSIPTQEERVRKVSAVAEMAPDIDPRAVIDRCSNSPVEVPVATGEGHILDGEVTGIANRMLEFSQAEGVDDQGEYDRLQVWVAYTGAGIPPPSADNRRPTTRWERGGSGSSPRRVIPMLRNREEPGAKRSNGAR